MTPPDSAPPAGIQDAARHLAEGRTGEAAALLERLVRDFPAYVTAHVLLAKAREAAGQPDRALESWHTAYFLMPGSPLVARERARLLHAEPARPGPTEMKPEGVEEPEGAEQPAAEAPEAGAPEAEPEPTAPASPVGADPTDWTTDEEGAPPTSGAAERHDEDVDWAIVEETEVPRTGDSGLTEPSVAPPPGHPARPPARPAAPAQSEGEPDDLDTLIAQLERAPRIRPDPEFHPDEPEPDADGAGDVVSETLAKIYETQRQYAEAARAYEQLAAQRPARADELRAKAAEMRRRADGAGQA